MKRLSIALMLAAVSSALAFAATASSHVKLTRVKAAHHRRDPRVTRHRAHKATKHRAPSHAHRTV